MYYIHGKNKEGDEILVNLERLSFIIKPKDKNQVIFSYGDKEVSFDYSSPQELEAHYANIKNLVEQKWKL
ncbi:MAG: hypothetical protein APR63_13205 [Desulfuromonas sp. SDB]|nr:MAG: hypothetical protein APR63_13205 [Desulfuromonas sp. SDB]